MKASKHGLRGLRNVFSFTLNQLLKSKSNVIMLVVLIVVSLLSFPVMTLISGGAFSFGKKNVTSVTIVNTTSLDLSDIGELASELPFSVSVTAAPTESEGGALAVTLEENAGQYTVVTDTDNETYQAALLSVTNLVSVCRLRSLGLSDEAIGAALKDVSSDYGRLVDGAPAEDSDFGTAYIVQLGYSIIVMMISLLSASYIIRTVIEEKVSKLVETMAISVDPPAMIFGKVLATLTFTLIEFGSIIVAAVISYNVTNLFVDTSATASISASIPVILASLNAPSIIVILVTVLIGCLSFALLSGLSGVGCSSMEDSGSANSASMLIIMLGYFVSLFTSVGTSVATILSIIPFISIFVAPAQFMLGNIGFGIVLISWIIQAAVIALLVVICSRVYKDMIFYKGNRIKLFKMISSAFKAPRKEAQ